MPKAKPSQVIVHRIELQETERELVQELVKSREAKNYASAVNSMALPILYGVGIFTAYLIADGIYEVVEKNGQKFARVGGEVPFIGQFLRPETKAGLKKFWGMI